MAIKMFVSDMDGTLLNSKREISAVNVGKIRQAVGDGLIFTVATGRMYRAALPYAQQLGIDVPLITHNGAVIKTVGGERLSINYIEPEMVTKVVDFADELGFYVHLYTEHDFCYRHPTKESEWYEDAVNMKGLQVGENLREHNQGIAKILIMDLSLQHVQEIMDKFHQRFGDSLQCQNSDPSHVEIMAPGVSKANAVLKLADMYHIKPEEIAAIGDSGNDVPMLKLAGTGIVVANANAAAIAAAEYQVASNDDNGVAEAIDRFFYHVL